MAELAEQLLLLRAVLLFIEFIVGSMPCLQYLMIAKSWPKSIHLHRCHLPRFLLDQQLPFSSLVSPPSFALEVLQEDCW